MPRLRYRCTLPLTPECHTNHTINCKADYTRLLPLWPTHEPYVILREAHTEYERIHHHNRRRYRIGADSLASAPTASAPPGNNSAPPPQSPRMAPRLPPPRLARQQWPPPRTAPPRLQTGTRTDPRSPKVTRPLGRRQRPSPIPRRARTARLTAGAHPNAPKHARPGRVLLPCPRADL